MTDGTEKKSFAASMGWAFGRGVGLFFAAVILFGLFTLAIAFVTPDEGAASLAEGIAALDWKVVAVICAGIIGGAILMKD